MSYKDPQKNREWMAQWVAKNQERHRANAKAWHAAHPEYYAQQREKHREKRLAAEKISREKNREKRKAQSRAWHAKNKSAQAEYRKLYRALNKPKLLAMKNQRRALVKSSAERLSGADWLGLLAEFNFCCAYCGSGGPLERDHVYPLARGGSDGASNVVPACRGCNASKRSSLPIQWMLANAVA